MLASRASARQDHHAKCAPRARLGRIHARTRGRPVPDSRASRARLARTQTPTRGVGWGFTGGAQVGHRGRTGGVSIVGTRDLDALAPLCRTGPGRSPARPSRPPPRSRGGAARGGGGAVTLGALRVRVGPPPLLPRRPRPPGAAGGGGPLARPHAATPLPLPR